MTLKERIDEYYAGDETQYNYIYGQLRLMAFKAGALMGPEDVYKVTALQLLPETIKEVRKTKNAGNFLRSIKAQLRFKMHRHFGHEERLVSKFSKKEMYSMVDDFCGGDESRIKDIIEGYLPLAIAEAFSAKGPGVPKDEINAQAQFALTYAVHAFSLLKEKRSNALTKFIRTTIRRSLKDFINDYPMVKVPRTTARDWSKTEKAVPPKQVDIEFIEEVAIFNEVFNDTMTEMDGLILELDLSIDEMMILEALMAGLKQSEIAEKTNLTRETVTRKIRRIRNRAKFTLFN